MNTSTQKLEVNYQNNSSEGGLLLPRLVKMVATTNGKIIKINLDIKSINTQPIDAYPFNIPSGYERKN